MSSLDRMNQKEQDETAMGQNELAWLQHATTQLVVDQSSFIRKRPFFANKNVTFPKLLRTSRLSLAGAMLGKNASYEDSFTACQITPENHGSLLHSLLNVQQASRSPFSGQIVADWIFFTRFTNPPPSTCTLTFARSFAELSRKYPYSQTPAISKGRVEGKTSTRGLGVWLSQSLTCLELVS